MTRSVLTPEQIEEMDRLQRRYFNENVDLFEPPLPEGVPERLAATVKAGRIGRGEKVMDVGTGTGILIPYLLRRGPSEIHACDLAENMLRRVKEKFPGALAVPPSRIFRFIIPVSDFPKRQGKIKGRHEK